MTPKLVFELVQAWELRASRWETASALDRRKASFANELTWYEGYADGSEAPHGIVAANWNDQGTFDIPSRLCAVFEKLGVEIEWSDQVSSCGDCGKCIRTEPDSYGWQPDYVVTDGDILCSACAENDAETLLEEAEGGTWNNPRIDPSEHGYVALPEEYETGWHPGQTDDPRAVLKALAAKGITRALVVIEDVGQFDSKWRVYVHESDLPEEQEEASEEVSP